jgi:hypothetical protein
MEVQVNLDFVYFNWHALAIPRHSKISPKGLLKSLLVGTSSMLPKRVSARNSDMILASTAGL